MSEGRVKRTAICSARLLRTERTSTLVALFLLAALAFSVGSMPVAAESERMEFDPRGIFGGPRSGAQVQDPYAAPSAPEPATAGRRVAPIGLAARPVLTWRVENPFRLFDDPRETERHRHVFESLSPEQRRAPVLSAERMLAQDLPFGWAEQVFGAVCWDPASNLHRCPGGGDYVDPDHHAVLARIEQVPDAEVLRCVWRLEPRPGADAGRERQANPVTVPCNDEARLVIPYPAGADVTVEIGEVEVARTRIVVQDLLIVGVGDSFGSGEGNPDVAVRFDPDREADYGIAGENFAVAGYPARVGAWRQIGDREFQRHNARWLDQACHRSLYSNQLRAALQLAVEDPHRAVTFLHLACSGAEITRGLFLRYTGHEWVPDPPEFSQISAIAKAQCGPRETKVQILPEAYHMGGAIPELMGALTLHECDRRHSRKIDLLLVSIGGNDMGFARLVANAVLDQQSLLRRLGGWLGQVHDRKMAEAQLVELEQRYRALKRATHYILNIPWAESDRVILTAYPPMALLEDGRTICPSGTSGMEVLPVFRLDERDAADGEKAAERLHQLMRRAARQHGWTFVESHRAQFKGRGICAGYSGGIALSSAEDLRFPRRIGGTWEPFSPADFRPYAPRQRWFRTPNDAFLTGHFHVAGSLMQNILRNRNLTWTQVLLASTYSGAFHPTAEGHAAIADGVVVAARRVLEKYSGRNRQK
ncbi:MAG: hypothetical protein ACFCUN_05150 [Hyphomicrobiaceae bacterium]